jgi:hypothetical protein
MAEKNTSSAANPPADVPMPTIGKPSVLVATGEEGPAGSVLEVGFVQVASFFLRARFGGFPFAPVFFFMVTSYLFLPIVSSFA